MNLRLNEIIFVFIFEILMIYLLYMSRARSNESSMKLNPAERHDRGKKIKTFTDILKTPVKVIKNINSF